MTPLSKLRRLARDVRQLARALWRGDPDVSYDDLRQRESLYRLLAEQSRDIIWLLDFPDRITYVSPACREILGWDPIEQLKRRESLQMLTEQSEDHVGKLMAAAIAKRLPSLTYEAEHRRKDGGTTWCEVHHRILYDEKGRALSTIGVTRDINERRQLQDQLMRAQKAEAIGTLAGGVAHDFNNFLTVILGTLDLIREERKEDGPLVRLLGEAQDAAEGSAALTGQLLAFSHHQPTSIAPIDINALVQRADKLMRRAVGERIQLDIALGRDLHAARADDNQVHQILLNLVMNARDAIAEDGNIRIETANACVEIGSADAPPGLAAGDYVTISVSDDGSGMDESVRRMAIEPFFSTKQKGRGTGLGLAMVKSILDRLGGAISIASASASGTAVTISLPADVTTEDVQQPPRRSTRVAEELRGDEHVLVVEDEDSVRLVACRLLGNAGYTTHEAANPADAIEMMEQLARAGQAPDLVLTDLVMPEMSGLELAARIRASYGSVRFVLMSGYAESDVAELSTGDIPGPLLTKPFHSSELLRAIRSGLEAPESGGSSP